MKRFTVKQQIWFSSEPSTELKSLEPAFKKLLLVHQKYIDREEGDYPHWYSERPHVSLLAAAVWLSGGTALEEYRTTKTKGGKNKSGRCDLGIRTNKGVTH